MTPQDDLELALDRSDFYAGRGERPASIELPDLARVLRAIERLNLLAHSQFLTLTDPVASYRAGDDPYREAAVGDDLDERAARRGVRFRDITTWTSTGRSIDQQGDQVRLARQIPFKLIMADQVGALIPLQPGAKSLHGGALLVRDPAVLSVLHATHTALWTALELMPVPAADAPPPAELLPVLHELLSGRPDTAAARRIGISPRTYSRRVAALTRLLEVASRTQIGAAAAERGWC